MAQIQTAIHSLPDSVQKLIHFSIARLQPETIILFGSRARGDFREDSDFDFAFVLGAHGHKVWSRFLADVEELPLTLFKVDLVELDKLDQAYKDRIQHEGRLIYG